MATYPAYALNDLAEFSGRDSSEYTRAGYVSTAIAQATLLFKLGTCLGDNWPDDPTKAMLAKNAILAMADAIYLVQPFQAVLSNPFSSETIGSYSYSKVAGAVMGGLPTGIGWFDLALSQLSVCDLNDNIPMGGGIEMFEHDGTFGAGSGLNIRFLSPQDINSARTWGFDPAPGYRSGPKILDGGTYDVSGPNFDGGKF
jgi:hypothetical protein